MANQFGFRPTTYGYGAFPTTWDGWALILGFAVLLGASAFVVAALADRMGPAAWALWMLFSLGLTATLVVVSRKKTDGEWRWRGGKRGWLN